MRFALAVDWDLVCMEDAEEGCMTNAVESSDMMFVCLFVCLFVWSLEFRHAAAGVGVNGVIYT